MNRNFLVTVKNWEQVSHREKSDHHAKTTTTTSKINKQNKQICVWKSQALDIAGM